MVFLVLPDLDYASMTCMLLRWVYSSRKVIPTYCSVGLSSRFGFHVFTCSRNCVLKTCSQDLGQDGWRIGVRFDWRGNSVWAQMSHPENEAFSVENGLVVSFQDIQPVDCPLSSPFMCSAHCMLAKHIV